MGAVHLENDISETTNLSKSNPEVLSKLIKIASEAHAPSVEGTFTTTELHERDRAASLVGLLLSQSSRAQKIRQRRKRLKTEGPIDELVRVRLIKDNQKERRCVEGTGFVY